MEDRLTVAVCGHLELYDTTKNRAVWYDDTQRTRRKGQPSSYQLHFTVNAVSSSISPVSIHITREKQNTSANNTYFCVLEDKRFGHRPNKSSISQSWKSLQMVSILWTTDEAGHPVRCHLNKHFDQNTYILLNLKQYASYRNPVNAGIYSGANEHTALFLKDETCLGLRNLPDRSHFIRVLQGTAMQDCDGPGSHQSGYIF